MPSYPHANAKRVTVKKAGPSSSGPEPAKVKNESPSSSFTVKKEHSSKAQRTQPLGSSQSVGRSTQNSNGGQKVTSKMETNTTTKNENTQQNEGISLAPSNQSSVAVAQNHKSVNLSQRLSKSQKKNKRAQALFPGVELQKAREMLRQHNRNARKRQPNESWKYSLVSTKSERDAITAKVRAKNNLDEACFTLKPIEDGYVFVKKGNVYITRTAKKYTRELGKTVYIVHKGLNSVLGIQVPKEVHEKAVAHEEMTREDRKHVNDLKEKREKREALLCLRGMFGNMPEEEQESIVNRAFEKYSGRVGRTQLICLPERLRYAVNAHLRHSHTDYEKQLIELAKQRVKKMVFTGKKMHKNQKRATKNEREKARQMVAKKIEEVWQSWEPCMPRPWDSLKHKNKSEFIAKGKLKAMSSEDESDQDDDGWISDANEDKDEDEEEEDDEDDWSELGHSDGEDSNVSSGEELKDESDDDLMDELRSVARLDIRTFNSTKRKRTLNSKISGSPSVKRKKVASDAESDSDYSDPYGGLTTTSTRRITRSLRSTSTSSRAPPDCKVAAFKPKRRDAKLDIGSSDDDALYSRPLHPSVTISSGGKPSAIKPHIKPEKVDRRQEAQAKKEEPEVIWISD